MKALRVNVRVVKAKMGRSCRSGCAAPSLPAGSSSGRIYAQSIPFLRAPVDGIIRYGVQTGRCRLNRILLEVGLESHARLMHLSPNVPRCSMVRHQRVFLRICRHIMDESTAVAHESLEGVTGICDAER